MDDFEGVFEKRISRFIWAKCHIKLNHAIYILNEYKFIYILVNDQELKMSEHSVVTFLKITKHPYGSW